MIHEREADRARSRGRRVTAPGNLGRRAGVIRTVPASPYRRRLLREEAPPLLRAPRGRPRARSLLARCVVGSLLAHGALAVSSASLSAAPVENESDISLPEWESDTLFVPFHPTLDTLWSPPPALAACFDDTVIGAMRERMQPGWSERVAFGPTKFMSWSELQSEGMVRRGSDDRSELIHDRFDECAEAAKLAGPDPGVRYQVRGASGSDGAPHVSVLAADGPDLGEGLRCCLTQTAVFLLPMLRGDEELRYDGGPHSHGAALIEPGDG